MGDTLGAPDRAAGPYAVGVTTFSAVLSDLLRRDPGRPLVTFYDHATGERVELSVTTYANWVAKACSLLVDEHGLERGDRVRIDLPPHWLGHVFLGAAWYAGLVVDLRGDVAGPTDPSDLPGAVVCGPDGLDRWAEHADDLPVLACSLLPLGVRFATPLPVGVHDVGVEIWGQPDAFAPWEPAEPDDAAVLLTDGPLSQAAMWEAAAAGSLLSDGGRLLAVSNPASPPGFSTFTEPLARSGSVVLVAHPDPDRLGSTAHDERVTVREDA
ncbi:TIGR03089 family protein [Nocardioides fonticola]|uniref:TIGR03089 family protein n=1 Tax=Nocardioides fonticola TaxID=450363 RepID=A0ABP7XDW7_9ACTN